MQELSTESDETIDQSRQAGRKNMKIISLNCRWLGNPQTVRALKKIISLENLDMIFIMETKRKDYKLFQLSNIGNLDCLAAVSCAMEGKHRVVGLSCLWNNTVNIDIRGMSLNHILYDYN